MDRYKGYLWIGLFMLIVLVAGYAYTQSVQTDASPNTEQNVYMNTQYGFQVTLPESWEGYRVVENSWEGYAEWSASQVEQGPLISIRHPQWTEQVPRQDIPIMVFTTAQWSALQQDSFHIGAAPFNPNELGRTTRHVFALPARYNYAFPVGYEEVEQILKEDHFKLL